MNKLIVIDPHVIARSPSMRGWLGALPAFRHLFDEIEVWATACDLGSSDGVNWRRIPQRLPTWTLHSFEFQHLATRMLARLQPDPGRIVQVTGCLVPVADIRYMHFWNCALLEERAKRPLDLRLGPVQLFGAQWSARQERKIAADPNSTGNWWVVSKSIQDRISEQAAGGEFRVLPNQYDPTRFNTNQRVTWREKMRAHYAIEASEKILVFSAFGSFERKGLPQALKCVDILRKKGFSIRLLVLGGSPLALRKTRKRMMAEGISADCCILAGMVDHIERHISAADGFFFPSHFEAFSLAEIESAALGLRLYLTPHYGTEMILDDPTNGRLLPWDPEGMAKVIEEEIRNECLGIPHHSMGEALTPEGYTERISSLYKEVIASKSSQL